MIKIIISFPVHNGSLSAPPITLTSYRRRLYTVALLSLSLHTHIYLHRLSFSFCSLSLSVFLLHAAVYFRHTYHAHQRDGESHVGIPRARLAFPRGREFSRDVDKGGTTSRAIAVGLFECVNICTCRPRTRARKREGERERENLRLLSSARSALYSAPLSLRASRVCDAMRELSSMREREVEQLTFGRFWVNNGLAASVRRRLVERWVFRGRGERSRSSRWMILEWITFFPSRRLKRLGELYYILVYFILYHL